MIITDLIKEEIRCWSKEVLEVPSENFEQLPPCPYAKQAWKKDKVKIHVTDDISLATRIKKNNPPVDDKVEVIAWTNWNKMSADEFDKWVDVQNDEHQGTWIIGFHPDHPEDANIDEFEGNDSPEYAMILVQSLAHLSRASKKILKRGYYARYSTPDIEHIKWRNAQ